MRAIATSFVLIALVAAPATAQDPDPAKFTPPGYTFCGWKDFQYGGWAMHWDDRLSGAYLVLFAKRMTCSVARWNYRRTKFDESRPYRRGYYCDTIREAHEFLDYRCSKLGRPKRAYRVQTGA